MRRSGNTSVVAAWMLAGTVVASFALSARAQILRPELPPTPTPAGFRVSGHVAEFPLCSGSMRGVTVTLLPLGRTSQTSLDAGLFSFEGVPPGDYTLSLGHYCNPFGCYPDTPVSVSNADVSVEICPLARTATATPTPHDVTVAPTFTPTSCVSDPPQVYPVTSPTNLLTQVIHGYGRALFCSRGGVVSIFGVEVISLDKDCINGTFTAEVRLEPKQVNHVTVCQSGGMCGTGGCTTVDIVQTDDPPTITPTATPTATSTSTCPCLGSPTPTATICPMETPVPLWVEPVTSPTGELWQVVAVRSGSADRVEIITESGTFTANGDFSMNDPAQVYVRLAANTTHHLQVSAHIKEAVFGGCHFGGYTLHTSRDMNGASLVIVQDMSLAVPTVPPTLTPTPNGALLEVTPTTLTLNCSGTFEIRIANTGEVGSHLVIPAIDIRHGYSQGDYGHGFSWDTSDLTFPLSLGGGESVAIPVSFSAASESYPSRLHVSFDNNSDNEPHVFLTYFGQLCGSTATPTPSWTVPTPSATTTSSTPSLTPTRTQSASDEGGGGCAIAAPNRGDLWPLLLLGGCTLMVAASRRGRRT